MSPITFTEPDLRPVSRTLLPASHFKLALIAAALRIRDVIDAEGSRDDFPFLESYAQEAADWCGSAASNPELLHPFRQMLARSQPQAADWPLRALETQAGLSSEAVDVLLTIGLIEEDPRFGAVFEWAQPACPQQQRPTQALLTAWWRDQDDCVAIRALLRRLCELSLIRVVNPEAPRLYWAYETDPILWDVLRGETDLAAAPWLSYTSREQLPLLDNLILPPDLEEKSRRLPHLFASGEIGSVLVRGPMHNCRRTLLRAMARASGYGVIELQAEAKLEASRAACLGTLCLLLRAIPSFLLELAPGETAAIPVLGSYTGPQAVALGRHGRIEGSFAERSIVLELPLPGYNMRRRVWSSALQTLEDATPAWADNFRLTSGGIVRAAALGRRQASLEGAVEIDDGLIRRGSRSLQQPLESLAARIQDSAGWERIVAAPDIVAELRTLSTRCRFREQLGDSPGVKALFGGPSGTGKTLAARVLAAELQLDLYRLDLSAIVNKYIGETEKNLNQLLSRAEELNVVLLIDEGDSLLANRTAVQSSNDRYANLETNFLLQRIESFEGILLITTNALHRIDSAFQRRMDVLIEFRMPEPEERRQIWRLHLPADHQVSEIWIEEAARRCSLSGAQIRNAALHASLLALEGGTRVTTHHAATAVLREYHKLGAVCPLRRTDGR
jgi:hypothetical protein